MSTTRLERSKGSICSLSLAQSGQSSSRPRSSTDVAAAVCFVASLTAPTTLKTYQTAPEDLLTYLSDGYVVRTDWIN